MFPLKLPVSKFCFLKVDNIILDPDSNLAKIQIPDPYLDPQNWSAVRFRYGPPPWCGWVSLGERVAECCIPFPAFHTENVR